MKNKILVMLIGVMLGVAVLNGAAGEVVMASGGSDSGNSETCGEAFMGFYPWYNGLTDDNCEIETPSGDDEIKTFVWTIIINIAADLMLAIGYIAVGFIIYGGFLFITANGDPGQVAKARKTLTYAIVGTIIAILASTIAHAFISVLKGGE